MAFADLVATVDRAAQNHLGGVTAVYKPQHEDPIEVEGLFDASYVLVDPGQGRGGEQVAPVLFVRVADLPVHPDEDEPLITVNGKDYEVQERQPDSMGGIRLVLKRVT